MPPLNGRRRRRTDDGWGGEEKDGIHTYVHTCCTVESQLTDGYPLYYACIANFRMDYYRLQSTVPPSLPTTTIQTGLRTIP